MSGTALSVHEQWMQVKDALRAALDADEAMAWLPGLELAHLSPERAVLAGAPNAFFQQRILRQFAPLIRGSLAGAFADWGLRADFQLDVQVAAPVPERKARGARAQGRAAPPRRDAAEPAPASESSQLSLFPQDAEPLEAFWAAGAPPQPPAHDAREGAEPEPLSGAEAVSFAAFKVGEENRIAYAMAREVAGRAGQPGESGAFSAPFILAGPSGSGKTHLLAAIAEAFAARHPDWRIVRRSAEQFTVEVLDGIRRKSMPALRQTYRGADALLIDDLGFIEVSAKAQEELLHTFEALHGAGRPIALATDRLPSALHGLSEPLRSRLEAGLMAQLELPGFETRLAILRGGALRAGLELGEPDLRFLAERITGSARKLEGALVRMTAHVSMLRRPLDSASVRQLAAPWLDPEPAPALQLAPDAVLAAVCAEFGLTLRQLRGRERSRQRDLARQMAMRLLRERGGLASGEIGRWLGNRAHSTVVEAIAALQRKLQGDARLRQTWARLEKRVDSRRE